MPKAKTWERSIGEISDSIHDGVAAMIAPVSKLAADIICTVHGHDERMMNKVVRRGTMDASGGSDITMYTPYYCARCGDRWRENENGDIIP